MVGEKGERERVGEREREPSIDNIGFHSPLSHGRQMFSSICQDFQYLQRLLEFLCECIIVGWVASTLPVEQKSVFKPQGRAQEVSEYSKEAPE